MVIQKMNIIAIAQKMLLRKNLQPLIDSGVIGLTEKKAIEPESEVLYKIKYHRCSHHDHIGDIFISYFGSRTVNTLPPPSLSVTEISP